MTGTTAQGNRAIAATAIALAALCAIAFAAFTDRLPEAGMWQEIVSGAEHAIRL